MRVAIFSPTIDPRDGYGNITKELCMHMHADGVDFELFLPVNKKETTDESGFPFKIRFCLPPYIFRIYQPKGIKYFFPVDVSGFDLVQSLFAFPYCIVAARSANKYKIPYIMGAQGTHGVRPLTYFPEKLLMKRCYADARAITVPSAFTRRKICEYAGKEYTINVIHNGVNFERFQKQPDVAAVRDRFAGRKILLTVGGLWGRKGQDLVIRALPQVIQSHPNVQYVMVGDGNARSGLESLASELGVRDHVTFAGRKSGDELVSYFHACDVYVHTPKVIDLKFEGFGIVYLEASACGKPIVATDAGGIRDAVLDEETGLIADDGDIEGVAERIVRILDDVDLGKRLGESGRKYAAENDWGYIAQQFQKLYV